MDVIVKEALTMTLFHYEALRQTEKVMRLRPFVY